MISSVCCPCGVPATITLKRELCCPVPANRVFIKRRPTRPGRLARTSRRIRPKEEPRAEDSYRGRSARGQVVGVGYRAGTGVGGGGNATAVVGTEPTLRRSFSLTRLPGRGLKPRQITRRNEINPNRTGRTCGLFVLFFHSPRATPARSVNKFLKNHYFFSFVFIGFFVFSLPSE